MAFQRFLRIAFYFILAAICVIPLSVVAEDDEAHDVVFAPTDQDTEYELSAVVDAPGTWAVNCFFLAEGGDIEYPTVFEAVDG